MNIFDLPTNIIKHIYEFDSTYHNVYTKLKYEFKLKTPFWRMKWLHNNMLGFNKEDDIALYHYDSYDYQIKALVHYWNYNYKGYYNRKDGGYTLQPRNTIGKMEPFYTKCANNCTNEFITDENPKGAIVYMLNHINILKGYIANETGSKLYKPCKILK